MLVTMTKTRSQTLKTMIGSVLMILMLQCVGLAWGSCKFPEYLQARGKQGQRREWHMHIRENSRRGRRERQEDKTPEYPIVLTFNGVNMDGSLVGVRNDYNTPRSFSRQCVVEIHHNMYLVTHTEEGNPMQRYMCIKFIKRSDDVVQIFASRVRKVQSPKLCDESGMRMNEWPMINKVSVYKSYTKCPLQGGFNLKIFDKRVGKSNCDAYDGEVRLESECMLGDGMFFRFRKSQCLPHGLHMHTDQQVFCMGSWEHGENTYSVLRHAKADHYWCFRHPTSHDPVFVGYLFRDLHCDMSSFPKTDNYLRVEGIRDNSWPLSSLCMDDYEACSFWTDPCSQEGAMTCAKRCGVCSDKRPVTCTLPADLRGEWMQGGRPGAYNDSLVTVTDMFLRFEDGSNFRCVEWDASDMIQTPEKMEKMFVTTFENGCRPRYSCAQFKKRSPSILRMKLSQNQPWPFKDVDSSSIDCSTFHYKDDDEPFGDKYRSKHYKVLASQEGLEERWSHVDCMLDETKEFTVTYDDGAVCRGSLSSKRPDKKKYLKMSLKSCPSKSRNMDYACLDSVRHGFISDQIIIAETMSEVKTVVCWFFPVYPTYTFYMLHIRDCNEAAGDKIGSALIKPLATFKIKPPPTTTSTTSASTTTAETVRIVDGVIVGDVVSMTSHPNPRPRKSDAQHSEDSGAAVSGEKGSNAGYSIDADPEKKVDASGVESPGEVGSSSGSPLHSTNVALTSALFCTIFVVVYS